MFVYLYWKNNNNSLILKFLNTMACTKYYGSCSLCPWCGYEGCPNFFSLGRKEKKEYYIYMHDRKGGYLDVIYHSRNREDIIKKLEAMSAEGYTGRGTYKGEFCQKYRYTYDFDRNRIVRGMHPITDVKIVPFAEITITDGEGNWNTDVELILDINNHKLHYLKSWKDHIEYGKELELGKEWDKKIVFKKKVLN